MKRRRGACAFRWTILAGAVATMLVTPCAGRADEAESTDSTRSPASPDVTLTRPRFEASRPTGARLFLANPLPDPAPEATYLAFWRAAGLDGCDGLMLADQASAAFARLGPGGGPAAREAEETASPTVPASNEDANLAPSWG